MGLTAETCNCNALRQAERHVARLYERAFAPFGLTIDQYAAMAKLARLGPASIAALAERLAMDRAMISYVLKGLAARGLVDLARPEGDRRRRIVSLTAPGRALFAQATARWAATNAQVDAALGDRAAALRDLLKELEGLDLRHVEAPPPPAAPLAVATASH